MNDPKTRSMTPAAPAVTRPLFGLAARDRLTVGGLQVPLGGPVARGEGAEATLPLLVDAGDHVHVEVHRCPKTDLVSFHSYDRTTSVW
jgi:hypothetical protein